MTIAEVSGGGGGTFTLAVIPTTLERTTLSALKAGDAVNVETDMLARTVVNYLRMQAGAAGTLAIAGGSLAGRSWCMRKFDVRVGGGDDGEAARTGDRMSGLGSDSRPTIGITMGDPGGVGAEVMVKALADPGDTGAGAVCGIRAQRVDGVCGGSGGDRAVSGGGISMSGFAGTGGGGRRWWAVGAPLIRTMWWCWITTSFRSWAWTCAGPRRPADMASMQFVLDAINAANEGQDGRHRHRADLQGKLEARGI